MHYVYDTGILTISNRCLTWKIYNFFSLPLVVDCEIRSKQFMYGDSRYSLYIWPRGRKGSGTEEWFGICLYKYDTSGIGDSVQFSMVTENRAIKTCTVQCSENNLFRQERFMEWSDFQALSRKVAPGGCLTIVCRLPMENDIQSYKESENNSESFTTPMYDPPVKYQSGECKSSGPISGTSSLKVNSPEEPISSFTFSDFNPGPPSTTNMLNSSPLLENLFEYVPDSLETRNSAFVIPYDAPENQRSLTRDTRVNEKKRETTLGPETDISPNRAPKSVSDSMKLLPNTKNSPKLSNSFEVVSLQNGLPSVSCPIEIQPEEPSTSVDHCSAGLKIMSQQYRNLYLEGKIFDQTISMENRQFKVVKAFLMARSPVFAKMLSDNTSKNSTNTITIDPFDACDSSIFHDFLIYVYSGQVENLSEKNIHGLYCAANKFEMPELKEECVKFLNLSLSIDNITNILRTASNESELRNLATTFFARNMEVILKTDEWKQFMRAEPDRAVEFIQNALAIGFKKTLV